jgi:hypothetical protein
MENDHWSRALQALGHTVRLMPPSYVKPYLKRSKNDSAVATVSYPKTPSGMDWHYKAESLHR